MDEYRLNKHEVASSILEDLKNDNLSTSQREILKDYILDYSERHENNVRHQTALDLHERVYGEDDPDLNWSYLEMDLPGYLGSRIEEDDLHDFDPDGWREIPETGDEELSMGVGLTSRVGTVGYSWADRPESDDIWLTRKVHIDHPDIDQEKAAFYLNETEAKEHIEMLCNTGSERLAQRLAKDALITDEDEIAVGFAEIIAKYDPSKVEELADEEHSPEVNRELFHIAEEADSEKGTADRLVDFLNQNMDEEFGL